MRDHNEHSCTLTPQFKSYKTISVLHMCILLQSAGMTVCAKSQFGWNSNKNTCDHLDQIHDQLVCILFWLPLPIRYLKSFDVKHLIYYKSLAKKTYGQRKLMVEKNLGYTSMFSQVNTILANLTWWSYTSIFVDFLKQSVWDPKQMSTVAE